jgi:hypothetical protein
MSAVAEAQAPERSARLFSPVVVLWMALVGVFAFSALLVLSAYAPDLRSSQNGQAHALSNSAAGYAGLVELEKALGRQVVVSRGPIHDQGAPGILILTPPPVIADPQEVRRLAFQNRLVLLVLPKWVVFADNRHQGWVRKLGPVSPDDSLAPAKIEIPKEDQGKYTISGDPVVAGDDSPDNQPAPAAGPLTLVRDKAPGPLTLKPGQGWQVISNAMPVGPVDQLQTVSGDGWIPVVTDAQGRGIVVKRRDWPLYVLSDPDLLNTQGLKRLDTTRGAVAILDGLRGGEGPVIFDVTLNGFSRARSLLKLAFEPPFLALTLCAFAAAALMGWHAAMRFGPASRPDRAFALGKRALADNSAALIKLARREPRMASRYAASERAAAARLVGAPRDLDPEALDGFLDRLSVTREAQDRLSDLVADASRVKDNSALMDVARRLHRWRLEMTRERR